MATLFDNIHRRAHRVHARFHPHHGDRHAERDSYMTLTIRNLPLGTTEDDVFEHIRRQRHDSDPIVNPLTKETNQRTLCAVVTIRQETEEKCKVVRDKLHLTRIYPKFPAGDVKDSVVMVSDEFLGVTTIAEHDDPQFDMYFVHGLGGHAFKSWSTDKGAPHMWPRDFLPNDIKARPLDPMNWHGPKLAGRLATVGYRASAMCASAATATIDKISQNFLNHLRADRTEALIHALSKESHRLERFQDCQSTFFNGEECLVKGIFFFGTPFEGSRLARYASRIVKFLRGNDTLIESLSIESEDLNTIVARFDQMRNHPRTRIPIVIAYEMQPMFGMRFVTDPDSAISSFDCQTIGIEGDHRTMIKMENNQDQSYRDVAEFIIRMIQRTLSGSSIIPSSSAAKLERKVFQELPFRQNLARDESPPPYKGQDSCRPSTASSASDGTSASDPSPHSQPVGLGISDPKSEENDTPSISRSNIVPVRLDDLMMPPNRINGGKEDNRDFALLSKFDVVFLLDDTGSMMEAIEPAPSFNGNCEAKERSKWDEMIESLRYIVDIVTHYDRDGVDVHFFCRDDKDKFRIQDGQRVLDLLTNEVSPDEIGGGTFIAERLWTILTAYIDRFENYRLRMAQRAPCPEKPKMLNLIVITDGAADDKDAVEDVIVNAAKRLDELRALPNQVGIQFLQIGRNEAASRWLKTLDDDLNEKHRVRDMVDTRPWDRVDEIDKSLQERLTNILLGGIDRARDME
ncbi:uncharacterized protein B0T23DRAFT_437943 [Neurospora hispaniola]|uniref:VWFA domain-containing protein n=1 Tax=Neurospora hispaniola TaxID=588809 RepID=A0AAJ0ICD6_9PEZI|nr:hypothetical protein B0T23DRAFT_437943 [Neurospora hispaniola]